MRRYGGGATIARAGAACWKFVPNAAVVPPPLRVGAPPRRRAPPRSLPRRWAVRSSSRKRRPALSSQAPTACASRCVGVAADPCACPLFTVRIRPCLPPPSLLSPGRRRLGLGLRVVGPRARPAPRAHTAPLLPRPHRQRPRWVGRQQPRQPVRSAAGRNNGEPGCAPPPHSPTPHSSPQLERGRPGPHGGAARHCQARHDARRGRLGQGKKEGGRVGGERREVGGPPLTSPLHP